jgi:tetratricopeptide (TPR) repeat protein
MGDDLLSRAVALHGQKRLGDAERLYREILNGAPDHPEALEGLGGLMFQRGQLAQANALFARALAARPRSALLHANLGEVLRLMGQQVDADRHLKLAVEIDPRLAQAWNSIGLVAHDRARYTAAESAFREALRIHPRFAPALINLANALAALNRPREAVAALQSALGIEPGNPIALQNLTSVLTQVGDPQSLSLAETHCRLGLAAVPERAQALANLANVFRLQGRLEEAAGLFRRSVERDPGLVAAHHGLGLALVEMGQPDQAERCFHEAVRLDARYAASWMALGRLQGQQGELEPSCRSYRAALAICPTLAEAYWRLAVTLKTRMPENEVSAMSRLLDASDLSDEQRALAHFGLATVLDGRGAYPAAASHFQTANRLQAASQRARGRYYDPDSHSRYIGLMIEAFHPGFLAERSSWGAADPRPVFIVGLPRSGTSLVEQILASHSEAHGAGELKHVDNLFRRLPELAARPDLDAFTALRHLTAESTRAAARQYLERLDLLAPPSARRVTDKMPDNYRMIGLIALLWPRAHVIVCRRDVRDIATSCWQNGFQSLPWSTNWDSMARRFADYQRMMEHWRLIKPMPWIEVAYESLVRDIEAQVRRLVDFVGLPWEAGCLDFHSRRRMVRTASFVQVREPVHTRSIGRWRDYQDALAPLLGLLDLYQVRIEAENGTSD